MWFQAQFWPNIPLSKTITTRFNSQNHKLNKMRLFVVVFWVVFSPPVVVCPFWQSSDKANEREVASVTKVGGRNQTNKIEQSVITRSRSLLLSTLLIGELLCTGFVGHSSEVFGTVSRSRTSSQEYRNAGLMAPARLQAASGESLWCSTPPAWRAKEIYEWPRPPEPIGGWFVE